MIKGLINKAVARILLRLRLPPWVWLLSASALLFLIGSASFGLGGQRHIAVVGVICAIAAVAVIVTFSD